MNSCVRETMMVQADSARHTTVLFEYVGYTSLLITGPATRKSYRFDQPGARVLVDGRDRLSLSTVPVLRVVDEFPA
jgi:hypothetical protein